MKASSTKVDMVRAEGAADRPVREGAHYEANEEDINGELDGQPSFNVSGIDSSPVKFGSPPKHEEAIEPIGGIGSL